MTKFVHFTLEENKQRFDEVDQIDCALPPRLLTYLNWQEFVQICVFLIYLFKIQPYSQF